MKRLLYFVFVFVLFNAFSSCRRGASKTKEVSRIDEKSESSIPLKPGPVRNPGDTVINKVEIENVSTSNYKKLVLPKLDYRFLSLKTKANVVLPGLNQNFNATIRMAKDSLIWISAGLFGMEGLRALITKDSVKVQDRIRRQYMVLGMSELSQMLHFDANFALLQSMILGQVPLEQQLTDGVFNESGLLRLIQQRGDLKIENLLGENNNLIKLNSSNVLTNSYLEMNFTRDAAEKIPTEVRGTGKDTKTNKTMGFGLNHSQINFLDENPGFTFQIPASYSIIKR